MIEYLYKMNQKLGDFLLSPDFKQMCNRFIKFTDELNSALPKIVEVIQDNTKNHPERIEKINYLARKGWFVSFASGKFTDIIPILDKFDYKNLEEIDALLVKQHKAEYVDACATLLEMNPNRKHLISEAIFAHNNGLFSLSTMSFISQSDGICREKSGVNLFVGLNASNQTTIIEEQKWQKSISELKNSELGKYLEFMFPYYTFYKNFNIGNDLFLSEANKQNKRPINFDGLNRHQIMHGECLDYNTEINSYKAFSLLCSTSFLLGARDE